MIDNLLPENEQFVPNDTDMNVSQYYLTGSYVVFQLSVKQSLFTSISGTNNSGTRRV